MIDWLAHHAPIIGLFIFLTFFIVAVAWTFRPGAREKYRKDAHIPLRNDEL